MMNKWTSLLIPQLGSAYKGFLLDTKATGGLSRPVRAPGSLGIVPPPPGSLGLQSLVPQPQSEKSKMSQISKVSNKWCFLDFFKLILKQQIHTWVTCQTSQMSNVKKVKHMSNVKYPMSKNDKCQMSNNVKTSTPSNVKCQTCNM